MKKMIGFFALLFCVLVSGAPSAMASEDVYYELGDGFTISVRADVCKIDNCINDGLDSDWYNYSTTSENVGGDGGDGQTLVVKPGDTLTFRGISASNVRRAIEPIFGTGFTNSEYLTFLDIFESGLDDVDGDGNSYQYHSANDITLSDGLMEEMGDQVGAITATVNEDAPDGAIITGTFYLLDPNAYITEVNFLGAESALADEGDVYMESTVRLQVSNPPAVEVKEVKEVTLNEPVLPEVLPTTGADKSPVLPLSLLVLSVGVSLGSFYILKSAKK